MMALERNQYLSDKGEGADHLLSLVLRRCNDVAIYGLYILIIELAEGIASGDGLNRRQIRRWEQNAANHQQLGKSTALINLVPHGVGFILLCFASSMYNRISDKALNSSSRIWCL
ncbi:unnamed protein product [Linum trigynum]|uniref:Receptor-like PK ALE2 N-terminal domain-containing protein n=1 Tax=Linum trigynum TaxID=586398 RepID=A0AAV2EES1_9ROSI